MNTIFIGIAGGTGSGKTAPLRSAASRTTITRTPSTPI